MPPSQDFLLVRPQDLVVLGVRWSGFDLVTPAGDADHPGLVAATDDALVTLTFPPQAVVEHVFREPIVQRDTLFVHSRLGGPSTVVFSVQAGTEITLTAEGILQALVGSGGRATVRGVDSSVEMPWHLTGGFRPQSATAGAVSDHASGPVPSRTGVFGLWHARLRADDGDAFDARLALMPRQWSPDESHVKNFALTAEHRRHIVDLSQPEPDPSGGTRQVLPRVRRLGLSALGGWLSASAAWPSFHWDHDLALGRDQRVRVLRKGRLYPFGHRAQYVAVTERVFVGVRDPTPSPPPPPVFPQDPDEPPPVEPLQTRAVAGLLTRRTLVITGPLQGDVSSPTFPFDEVEILAHSFDVDQPDNDAFFMPRVAGQALRFPLRCRLQRSRGPDPAGADDDVAFGMPLVFVSDATPVTAERVAVELGHHGDIELPGAARIDLVRGLTRQPGDVHEVHRLAIRTVARAGALYPDLSQFEVKLPALRELLPGHDTRRALRYSEAFLAGRDADVALTTVQPIAVDFTASADRSGGLVSPKFVVDGISRTLGPVATKTLSGAGTDLQAVLQAAYQDATLLGFPLASLIDVAAAAGRPGPPTIIQRLVPGVPPGVQMTWDLALKPHGPFKAIPGSPAPALKLTVDGTPPEPQTTCTVSNFALALPPKDGAALLMLSFASVTFTQSLGRAPDLEVNKLEVSFAGALELLKDLQTKVQKAIGDRSDRPTIQTSPTGITAGYGLSLPKVAAGVFVMQNVAVNVSVEVPFDGDAVMLSLSFASRDNPFSLTVSALGGGGYIVVWIQGDEGLALEVSLEFGAIIAVSFGIAEAEVHALGGVRFAKSLDGEITLDAFVRIGGSVNLLGVVSVSVELCVTLTFDPSPDPRLLGRATLVIEIDLTLYSQSVEIDSGVWELVGGDDGLLATRADADRGLPAWRQYRKAFVAP